ncbi:MAG: DUF421 domain-containing protein [Limisphaerales bacterium]
MSNIIHQSTEALVRSVILLVGSYTGLVLVLRLSGKRTLSKMNAFDLVVTVALGSTLATICLSKDTALLQGLLVLGLRVVLQDVVAWLSVRFEPFQNLVQARPALLFENGDFLDGSLRRERISREEILAAIGSSRISDCSQVGAVVLETDGTLSVLEQSANSDDSALKHVQPPK